MKRCEWSDSSELYQKYHDEEWGVPEYNDQKLFEFLNLEGAQAGLSWITVLKKKDHYYKVFDQWDAKKIVLYDDKKVQELLSDPGIIRNKLKVAAVINNAEMYLKIMENEGFSNYLWGFVNGKPIVNHYTEMSQTPASTELSNLISKDLKKRGFKFIGSTIVYAFMQAVGMVDDHLDYCFRRQ